MKSITRKLLTTVSAFLICMMGMSISTYATDTQSTTSTNDDQINRVVAITEVFGDGQKVTAVAIKYDKKIDNSKLEPSDFSVEGRTITKVYAGDTAKKSDEGKNGRYVIIELSPNDSNASTINSGMGGETPPSDSTVTQSGDTTEQSGAPQGGAATINTVSVSVTQVKDITYVDGSACAAMTEPVVNDRVINLVVDDFKQLEYTDPNTGTTLKYNLYVPKNYDPNKSYPMVMFIHDSSVCSTETKMTLVQGNGATVWATPSEQAKHECFVLAPQYSTSTVDDNYGTTQDLDVTMDLISSLESQYSIDTNRIYNTGQSMGGMSSMALDIKYPNVFAASLLVACQWDSTKTSALANNNIWAIVSEGDEKAFPGMTACVESMEAAGGKVSRASWDGGVNDGSATDEQKASDVAKVVAEDTNIKFTSFINGTVVPSSLENNSLNNHMHTWQLAYNIEGVRDWLFTQHK